jgi:hypothetical protein
VSVLAKSAKSLFENFVNSGEEQGIVGNSFPLLQFHENVSRKCSNNVIKYGKSWNICRHGDIINQLIIWIKITNTIVINWTLYCLPLFPKRRIAKIYFSLRRGKEFPTIPCSSPEFTKFSNKLLADFARTDTRHDDKYFMICRIWSHY